MEEKLFNLSNKIGKIKGYCNLDNGVYLALWQSWGVKVYTKVGKMYFEANAVSDNPIVCFVRIMDGEGEIFEIK